jgi:outer membrane protein assembly factor BamB
MMAVRRACRVVLACALAVAELAGCSSGPFPHPDPCCAASHAYALDVTTAGRVRWQVPLAGAVFGNVSGMLSPLAVGAVAVFAQGDVIYGLRLADGHRVWSRATSQDIAGMWRWQSLVIVLTESGPGLPLPLLTGLDASTGQARWTLRIAGDVEGSDPTADGGLAILRYDDTLEVADLSSGRVRWTRPAGYPPDSGQGYPPTMAVADGAVLFAVNGKLTSYDDRTGQIRWTDALMPILVAAGLGELGLQATAGLVYLTGARLLLAGGKSTPVLLGISAADGHVEWRFATSPPETLWNYAPGLMSVTSSSGGTWQDELDPATGRVRWQAASLYRAIATPAGTVTAPGTGSTDQISLHDTLTGQTRWIATLAGLNLGWQQQAPALPVFPAGPLLVVPAAGPDGSHLLAALRMSDGQRAWQLRIPAPVAAPPLAVPGGMLVSSATVHSPP